MIKTGAGKLQGEAKLTPKQKVAAKAIKEVKVEEVVQAPVVPRDKADGEPV